MSSSGTRKREEMLDADGNAIVDGLLTPTPDSPADSEWRSRAGPLDVNDGGGPWKQEDSSGRWFPRAIPRLFFLSPLKLRSSGRESLSLSLFFSKRSDFSFEEKKRDEKTNKSNEEDFFLPTPEEEEN